MHSVWSDAASVFDRLIASCTRKTCSLRSKSGRRGDANRLVDERVLHGGLGLGLTIVR